MIEPGPRYQIAAATIAGAVLRVDWRDGHRSEFHPLWLRHQCHCDFLRYFGQCRARQCAAKAPVAGHGRLAPHT